ncbi:sigma-70 family RNA polymerase sigma factor [Chitinophaga sp. YIM B06452]|uniref:RNA polymerase sigma factor n=1 Tax=Chitinophaga sp. YIM B06452 TaxID=3082158 RepID=UPI0031FEA118
MAYSGGYIDETIYDRVAAGEEQAFRELFDLYVPRLQAVVYRITRSEAIADDLVQETFLKVWVTRDQLADVDNPGAWITRIAVRLALNYVRRQTVHGRVIQNIEYRHLQDDIVNHTAQTVEFRQLIHLVEEAVAQLPARQQQAYRLSREQGLSISEIAAQMGLAVSTIKNLLVMAMKDIRHYLEKAGYPTALIVSYILLV